MFDQNYTRTVLMAVVLMAGSVGWADDVNDLGAVAGTASSGFDPPEANDRCFVVDSGPGLDTGGSQGRLIINIPIDRYLGPTDADGHLLNADAMVASGVLSEFATLTMPAFNVEYGNTVDPVLPQPQRDRVFFNHVRVNTLFSGNAVAGTFPSGNNEFLRGRKNIWRLNTFQIPIQNLRFPSATGPPDKGPKPALNTVWIDVDVLQSDESTEIDWVAIDFKTMSPVILIHGNGSDGGFFVRRGFTAGLNAQGLLWDNSISLFTDSRRRQSVKLNTLIPKIVKRLGVDSVHLVCHSKGGLDARDYLVTYQPKHNHLFSVLSYTTLSTPHNGSVLADVGVTRRAAARRAETVHFDNFPEGVNTLTYLADFTGDAGLTSLTLSNTAMFNRGTIKNLTSFTFYNAVAGDADTNANFSIDFPVPDEFLDLRQESPSLAIIHFFNTAKSTATINTVYQTLATTGNVKLTINFVPSIVADFYVATVTGVSDVNLPVPNDTMVTISSGLGEGTLGPLLTNTATFTGPAGRNHANIANSGVATTVAAWLIDIESTIGDLR